MKKEEDPYGGSTDENTDAEAEEDHPIPELPGTSVSLFLSVCPPISSFCSCHRHRNRSLPSMSDIAHTAKSNWIVFCLSGMPHTHSYKAQSVCCFSLSALMFLLFYHRVPIIATTTNCVVINCTCLLSLPVFSFLPDFLNGKHFFLYGKFPNNERRLLLRYIIAFNG